MTFVLSQITAEGQWKQLPESKEKKALTEMIRVLQEKGWKAVEQIGAFLAYDDDSYLPFQAKSVMHQTEGREAMCLFILRSYRDLFLRS